MAAVERSLRHRIEQLEGGHHRAGGQHLDLEVAAGEIAAIINEECFDALDAPIERVTSDDVPMPYAKNLEDEVQPQVNDVVAAVRRALYLD